MTSPEEALVEALAERVHEAWLSAARAHGHTSRLSPAGEEQMVPYPRLSEAAKDLDRVTVRAVLDGLVDRSQSPTGPEIDLAAAVLARLAPGFLPLPVFLQVARLSVTPVIEVVPVRRGPDGRVQVLLLQRPPEGAHWAGMVHTPGTVVRASDTDPGFADAFDRILGGEMAGVACGPPRFVRTVFHRVRRGVELAQVFRVEVLEEPTVGRFCDADGLPENLVDTQREFIAAAVAASRP